MMVLGSGFFLGSPDARAVETAINSYKKNVDAHSIEHYEMYARNFAPTGRPATSPITIMDLIYYHVYGDYRISTLVGPVPRSAFVYRTNPAPPHALTVDDRRVGGLPLPADTPDFPFANYINGEQDGLLGGFFSEALEPTTFENVNWFNQEIRSEAGGVRFHLPSLGTAMVKHHMTRNITEDLGKALGKEIEALSNYFEENNMEIHGVEGDKARFGIAPARDALEDPICSTLWRWITNNPEFIQLATAHPTVIDVMALQGQLAGIMTSNVGERKQACNAMGRRLLSSSTSTYQVGQPVNFREGSFPAAAVNATLDRVGIDPRFADFSDYIITAVNDNNYQLAYIDEEGDEPVVITQMGMPNIPLEVPEADLEPSFNPDTPAEFTEWKKKKKQWNVQSISTPVIIELHRIILDTFFLLQALVFMVPKGANQEAKKDYSYLSEGVNPTNARAPSADMFPNLGNPNAMRDAMRAFRPQDMHKNTKLFATKKKEGMKGGVLLDLASLRNYVILSSAIASRSAAIDKKGVDDFFGSDMLLAEVNWLSQALVSTGTVLTEEVKRTDLRAQTQFRRLSTVGTTPTALAAPETVFYQVDAPLLKDVITQYNEIYNEATIRTAFALTGLGNKTPAEIEKERLKQFREGEQNLANSIWGSITRRLTDVLDVDGVLPHLFFERLFTAVNKVFDRMNAIKSPFPAEWTGTNTVTMLTVDPTQLGQPTEDRFYKEALKQYIDHLKSQYKNNYYVASALVNGAENIKIELATDIESLRVAFINRIKNDSKNNKLKGTSFTFRAYGTIIPILRGEIAIPLQFREEYVAQQLDEQMKRELRQKTTEFGDRNVVLPPDHPQYREKEYTVDPDSGLTAANNPNQLPLPSFYPRVGDIVNLANDRVRRYMQGITNIVVSAGLAPGSPEALDLMDFFNYCLDDANYANTTITVEPIIWRSAVPEEQIWDGRDSVSEPPQLMRVTQYRETIGIQMSINNPNVVPAGIPWRAAPYDTFPMDVQPYPPNDYADYSSILFRKRTGPKFDADGADDTVNNVYLRPGGVFRNPVERAVNQNNIPEDSVGVFYATRNAIDQARAKLREERPEVLPVPIEDVVIDVPLPEIEPEPEEGESDFIKSDFIKGEPEPEPAPEPAEIVIPEMGRLADAVEASGRAYTQASADYASTGADFRAASENFLLAAQSFEQAGIRFEQLAEATREAIAVAGADAIEEAVAEDPEVPNNKSLKELFAELKPGKAVKTVENAMTKFREGLEDIDDDDAKKNANIMLTGLEGVKRVLDNLPERERIGFIMRGKAKIVDNVMEGDSSEVTKTQIKQRVYAWLAPSAFNQGEPTTEDSKDWRRQGFGILEQVARGELNPEQIKAAIGVLF